MLRRRYLRILWFFGLTILDEIFWDITLPHLGLRKLSLSTRERRMRSIARRFRKLAVQMGGVMIKVGQFLSARIDVLPHEITAELSGLQDEVAPAPFEQIRRILESELGSRIEEKFASFDTTPIAAASIGQVYSTKLLSTAEEASSCPQVVVKVQRPHIQEIVDTDLSALRIVGRWVERYGPIQKRANVPRLLEEFSRSLYEEIDYLNEGKNAERFAENFKDDPEVRVPHVVWSHTTRRVLTLEDVGGIKITDYASIEAAGIDRAEVASRLLNTYFKQIFEDAFFHADPHPGNLFVEVGEAQGETHPWKLVFVDFGMTGSLPENTFRGVREMLMGVGTQDAHRLIQSYQLLDLLLPGADTDLLERASKRVFERFWGKPTRELVELHPSDAREFLADFGDLIYEMPFQVPENLILLGRCVSILSGMCSGLDPNFNFWIILAPYAQKLVESENGNRWQMVLDELGIWVQKLVALPARADALMNRLEQGKLEVRVPALSQELQRLERSQRRTTLAVVFAAFLLGGVQFYLGGMTLLAAGFGGAAVLFLILTLLTH